MKSEQRFITESIRAFLGYYNAKKLNRLFKLSDIRKLNTIIARQNIGGYFYHLCLNKVFACLNIPADTFETWKRTSGRNLITNELNDREAIELINELTKNKIDYTYIKGLSMRHRCYGNEYVNSSVDIDLFIRKSDYAKVKNILLAGGYEIPVDYYIDKIAIKGPFEEFEKKEYEICFVKQQNALEFIVDLQWDFIGRDKSSVFHRIYSLEPFYRFDDIDEIEVKDYKIKIFRLETEFVNMSFHYAFHHGFKGIKWLTDICLFIKQYESKIDFESIFKIADINLKKILGIILMLSYDFNYQRKISKEQKKLFCVDKLLPFEYSFYKSMVFKPDGIVSDRIALRIIKILLPYKMIDRLSVINDSLKFMWRDRFNGELA
jgi:hypothetical protein